MPRGIKPEDEICANCNTTKTPQWRKADVGTLECNACGLYRKHHGCARPLKLKSRSPMKKVRRKRTRARRAPTEVKRIRSNPVPMTSSADAPSPSIARRSLRLSAAVIPIAGGPWSHLQHRPVYTTPVPPTMFPWGGIRPKRPVIYFRGVRYEQEDCIGVVPLYEQVYSSTPSPLDWKLHFRLRQRKDTPQTLGGILERERERRIQGKKYPDISILRPPERYAVITGFRSGGAEIKVKWLRVVTKTSSPTVAMDVMIDSLPPKHISPHQITRHLRFKKRLKNKKTNLPVLPRDDMPSDWDSEDLEKEVARYEVQLKEKVFLPYGGEEAKEDPRPVLTFGFPPPPFHGPPSSPERTKSSEVREKEEEEDPVPDEKKLRRPPWTHSWLQDQLLRDRIAVGMIVHR